MAAVRNVLVILASYALRAGAGTVVFILIARLLGPESFGEFAYWLAWATLFAIAVNFGFSSLVLRSFGAEPDRASQTFSEILLAKLCLATIPAIAGIVSWLCLPSREAAMFTLLCAGQTCDSFTEFFLLGFRMRMACAEEGKATSVSSLVHVVLVVSIVWYWPDPLSAAAAFAISRAVGMLITRARCMQCNGHLRRASLTTVKGSLQAGWAYALELGIFSVCAQLDSLLIVAALGPAALGVYQAGLKLVQGIVRFAPAGAQAILPSLASQRESGGFSNESRKVILIFLLTGGLSGLLLTLFGAGIAGVLLGSAYRSLTPLLPLFGVLLLLRFLETGVGMVVVACGLQRQKVGLVGFQLACLLTGGWPAIQYGGLIGWQWVTIASILGLLCLYGRLLASFDGCSSGLNRPAHGGRSP